MLAWITSLPSGRPSSGRRLGLSSDGGAELTLYTLQKSFPGSVGDCAVRLTSVASLASARRFSGRRLSLDSISSSSFFGSRGVFLRCARDGPELDGFVRSGSRERAEDDSEDQVVLTGHTRVDSHC